MMEIGGNGDFMPGEFWFVLTMLFGTAFVSMMVWIINRFLTRLDVTIDWLKNTVTELKETDKAQMKLLEKHDGSIERHDEELRKLIESAAYKKRR